jgi:transposase
MGSWILGFLCQYIHKHPYGKDISSQRSSEVFASIKEEAKQLFFRLQGSRRLETEYWTYDTTSISSYSETLKQAQYGYNKEGDRLPQINLALVFGEQSHLPFYCRKLSGNIPDSKTVRHLIKSLDDLGFKGIKLVLDRGFYRADNINALLKNRLKFLISAKMSLSFIRQELDPIYDDFRSFESFNDTYELYTHTIKTTWHYTENRPYKGDNVSCNRRIYLHYYYNIDKATEDEKAFDRKLMTLRNELLSGQRKTDHESLYIKYFQVHQTPKRGITVTVKEDAVKKTKKYYGFFVLMTNQKMSSIEALELYRNKDVVGKAFGNLKERLNLRRTLVSSEQSLDGKLFVEFIALIYLSYIKKKMQETNMFKTYSMQKMFDTLDLIECFQKPGKKLYFGELLQRQKDIYINLGIKPPTSL